MYMSVCALPKCLVSVEIRRWHQIHCNWICEWLWAPMQVLGTQCEFSARAISTLNHWAITPTFPLFRKNIMYSRLTTNSLSGPAFTFKLIEIQNAPPCSVLLYVFYANHQIVTIINISCVGGKSTGVDLVLLKGICL